MLSAYYEYKESSNPQICSIPSHWSERRLKFSYREVDQRSQTGEEEMLSVSHITGITPRSQKNVTMFLSESNVGLKQCQPSDIVVNTMWAWMAAMGVSAYSGIVSPSYGVYRSIRDDEYIPKYLNYLLRIDAYRAEYMRRSTGIRPSRLRLYPDKFLNLKFISPPLSEQNQIALYLDWKISQINKLINTKRRLVGLLQEQLDLMTNQAIANPHGKARLKHSSEVVRNWITRDNTRIYAPVGVLNRGRGVFHKEQLFGSDLGDSEFFKVEPDSLLISGQFAWEGAVAITSESEKGCIASHRYYMVRGNDDFCKTEYIWAFFQTRLGDLILNKCSHGAAGRNKPLNINELLNEFVPIPSAEVQERIAEQVQLYMKYRNLVKSYETLILEYKTRLISDVVTGRLDVCGVTVPEYDATDDNSTDADVDDDEEMEDFE